jgi:hypothetical protein
MWKSSLHSSAWMRANSSVNMIMDLGPSQNLLPCHLTKAVWWYRPSPGEGSFDCQSLFGRSDWLEQIANPSPLGSQNDSRAKWVGKTGFYRSSGAAAFVEWSSTVYSKTSEIGVSDAPTDRSDLRRLNRLNELSPAMTLSGMRRLIDSEGRLLFPFLYHIHVVVRGVGRSVGAFSSVRRAGRLRIASGHARRRMSGFTRGRWVSGGRTSQLSAPVSNVAVCERSTTDGALRARTWNASGLDPQGVAALPSGLFSPRLGRTNKDSPSGVRQQAGGPVGSWHQPGTHRVPRQGDVRNWSLAPREIGEADARANYVRSTGVAVLPGGVLLPAPSGPHQQGTPPWEFPGSKQGPPWVPGNRRNPLGSSAKATS